MKKHNNTYNIFRKECARFFGDRSLVFTSIIMPGLLIYLIYSMLGSNMQKEMEQDSAATKSTVVMVDNMPPQMVSLFESLDVNINTDKHDTATIFPKMRNKENDIVYVVFPPNFMASLPKTLSVDTSLTSILAMTKPAGDSSLRDTNAIIHGSVPNIQIYSNSANSTSSNVALMLTTSLNSWEMAQCNLFDINTSAAGSTENKFDLVTDEDKGDFMDSILSRLIPMLIMMLIFSGCMAVAPSSIAGEKERGTIATLLVTPLKRRELAFGKILSLSLFALMSGISSFIGIMLSLPKLVQNDGLTITYPLTSYISLLLIILSTVLGMISVVAVLSAWAKDVKSAGTYTLPLMLVVMAVSFSPMLGDGSLPHPFLYLIPFYNSAQAMAAVFAREITALPFVITICVNVFYTFLFTFILTRMFNSEKIMFNK